MRFFWPRSHKALPPQIKFRNFFIFWPSQKNRFKVVKIAKNSYLGYFSTYEHEFWWKDWLAPQTHAHEISDLSDKKWPRYSCSNFSKIDFLDFWPLKCGFLDSDHIIPNFLNQIWDFWYFMVPVQKRAFKGSKVQKTGFDPLDAVFFTPIT